MRNNSIIIIGTIALSSLISCSSNNNISKRKNIKDFELIYFENDKEASSTELNLKFYYENPANVEVNYEIKDFDDDLINVSIKDDFLTVEALAGEGISDVTLSINDLEYEFSVTLKQYKSIACLGDSLTYGHSWHNESYPVYLNQGLGTSVTVDNLGINGASITGYGGSSIKYSTTNEFNTANTSNYDAYFIMLGSNDANGWSNASSQYKSQYLSMLETLENNMKEDALIFIMTSPPTLDGNAFAIPNSVIESSVLPLQNEIGEDYNLVDINAAFKEYAKTKSLNNLFRSDGVHLSIDGANLVASTCIEALKSIERE